MRDLPVAVVDADGGSVARDLVRRLDASPGLHVAARPKDMAEADRLKAEVEALKGDIAAAAEVEVVVDVSLRGTHRALLQTIGCSHSTEAGSLKTIGRRHAIASRDRTSLWGRKNAVVVTPWWNERGEE